jgi:uncharacterized membrane protein
MDLYSVGLFVHIGAAIVLIGGSILATSAIRAAVLRATTLPELRGWLAAGRPLAIIDPVASFTLLGSGLYLTQAGGWWGAGWVHIAIVLWLANTAVAVVVVRPAMHELAICAMSAGDGPVGPALDRLRRTRRWSVGHHVLLANDVGVLYLMTNKPGYLGSIAAVVAVHGLLGLLPVAHRWVVRRHGPTLPLAASGDVRTAPAPGDGPIERGADVPGSRARWRR